MHLWTFCDQNGKIITRQLKQECKKMFFESSLSAQIVNIQSRLERAISGGIRNVTALRQQFMPLIEHYYNELMQNENKKDARSAMINLLHMELESANRVYEVFFLFSPRQDIVDFGNATKEQYDHDLFNTFS